MARYLTALNMIPGLGPKKIMTLLNKFRDLDEVFSLSPSRLEEIVGARVEGGDRLRSIMNSPEFIEEIEYIQKEGIGAVCWGDEEYPESLKNIYSPPPVLFYRGSLRSSDRDAIAIVGSRRCSAYGLQMAERLAFDLAEKDITVISGMASGIDTAAHRGALKAKGRTTAVMGSGFRHIYPPEARKIFPLMTENGAVMTEYLSEVLPARGNFPRRNRIISGMARGVVVVEAARKSGAMITVDFALQQGREVFAVPGRVDVHTCGGTNKLIQDGAKLVTGVNDILEELDMDLNLREEAGTVPETEGKEKSSKKTLTKEQRETLAAIDKGPPVHIDEISGRTGVGSQRLSEVLLELQLKGLIKQLPGARYIAKDEEYAR